MGCILIAPPVSAEDAKTNILWSADHATKQLNNNGVSSRHF